MTVLVLLGACAGDPGGELTGTRTGSNFETTFTRAFLAIVAYERADGGGLDSIGVIRMSTGDLTCDDLAIPWAEGQDPRRYASDLAIRPDTEDVSIVTGRNWGRRWVAPPGDGRIQDQEGSIPNVHGTIAPPTFDAWGYTNTVALSWRDPTCGGGTLTADTGWLWITTPVLERQMDDPVADLDALGVVLDVHDPVSFGFHVTSGTDYDVRGEFDASYCGAWLVGDRPSTDAPVDCR